MVSVALVFFCVVFLKLFPRQENLLLLSGLLWEKDGVDVWQDTTSGDSDGGQKLAQLLVVPDGELDVPWDDPGLLVVPGGVSGQLQDLGGEVLHDGGQVDRGAGSDPGGVLASLQIPSDPTDGELKASLGRLGDGLLAALSLSSSGHGALLFGVVGDVSGVRARRDVRVFCSLAVSAPPTIPFRPRRGDFLGSERNRSSRKPKKTRRAEKCFSPTQSVYISPFALRGRPRFFFALIFQKCELRFRIFLP